MAHESQAAKPPIKHHDFLSEKDCTKNLKAMATELEKVLTHENEYLKSQLIKYKKVIEEMQMAQERTLNSQKERYEEALKRLQE